LPLDTSGDLAISGDEPNPSTSDGSVTVAWEEEEIERLSQNLANSQPGRLMDQRNCLMYLLGRIINHSTRILGFKPNVNGFKIHLLENRTDKFKMECQSENEGQPIIIFHLEHTSRSVDIISKRFDPQRLNVYDVQLENFSLLTIFPDTYNHMNISLASEPSHTEGPEQMNVLLMPCYIPPSEHSIETIFKPDGEAYIETATVDAGENAGTVRYGQELKSDIL
jgi:hypothetical protein